MSLHTWQRRWSCQSIETIKYRALKELNQEILISHAFLVPKKVAYVRRQARFSRQDKMFRAFETIAALGIIQKPKAYSPEWFEWKEFASVVVTRLVISILHHLQRKRRIRSLFHLFIHLLSHGTTAGSLGWPPFWAGGDQRYVRCEQLQTWTSCLATWISYLDWSGIDSFPTVSAGLEANLFHVTSLETHSFLRVFSVRCDT